jgi:DNA-binding transcriptional ArsR family regulator
MTKGMNNIEVRIINRKSIIAALYQHGGMTSQAIARSLGLSLPTVSVILKELTRQGLVSPGAALKSSGGRRPLLNILKSDARFAVGISLSPKYWYGLASRLPLPTRRHTGRSCSRWSSSLSRMLRSIYPVFLDSAYRSRASSALTRPRSIARPRSVCKTWTLRK